MCFKKVLLLLSLTLTVSAEQFKTGFTEGADRYFVAPEIWTNPMEAWKVRNGRLEVHLPKSNINAHVLTHQIKKGDGGFQTSVTVGSATGNVKSAGFKIGIKSQLGDYRSALLFGRGINAGINNKGQLFIANKADGNVSGSPIKLELSVIEKNGKSQITLIASSKGKQVAALKSTAGALSGNVALVSNFGKTKPFKHWFDDWSLSGDKISENKEQTFGPILWTQYTLSRNVMKMVALIAPIGKSDAQICRLQLKKGNKWQTAQEIEIRSQSWTAHFRQENWDDTKDHEYRIAYNLKDDKGKVITHYWKGTIRRDPVNKKITVAGFTGNKSEAFPNALIAENVAKQNPDVLFFSGDQIYEDVGGYGIIREEGPDSLVNYLRKYYLFGWAFRDILKDRPSLILPDDHDVYQGNIWGNGGNQVTMKEHSKGGYNMFADFLNAVHATQVGHHPDAWDPKSNEKKYFSVSWRYGLRQSEFCDYC